MVRASGIPELRLFCHSITAGAQLLEAKHFLQSKLSSLLNSIELWAISSPVLPKVEDGGPDESIYEILQDVKAKVCSTPNIPFYEANKRRYPKLFMSLWMTSMTPLETYFWNF